MPIPYSFVTLSFTVSRKIVTNTRICTALLVSPTDHKASWYRIADLLTGRLNCHSFICLWCWYIVHRQIVRSADFESTLTVDLAI